MFPSAGNCADIEPIWFDGERLLQSQIIGGVIHDEIELLDDARHEDENFLPSKGTALR